MENIDAKNAETGNINTVSSILSKFRMNCKAFFLTYPRCNITIDNMIANLKDKACIERYVVARELHKTEEEYEFKNEYPHHLHVLIKYGYKRNITSQDYFDIMGFHPNIQAVKNWKNALAYVCKDGDFRTNVNFCSAEPDNFVRRKKDYDAWKAFNEEVERLDIKYPINFLDLTINKPDPSIKKRHIWLVTPPNFGKTYWIEETFANMKIYKRANNKYPFEEYDDEDIIVYDDIYGFRFDEIANISNTYKTKTQIYGDVRYKSKYWKMGHTRTMIILCNNEPWFNNIEGFESRFTTYYIKEASRFIDGKTEITYYLAPPKLVRS